jgi:hypothetical protein
MVLGQGIRQVTFLYIDAYEIKLHLSKDEPKRLVNSTRWKQEYTIEKFLKPIEQNWFVQDLVKNSDLAIEIIPCRVTDGVHLRNGFIRMLQQRLSTATDLERTDFNEALKTFRAMIPNKSIAKGSSMMFYKKNDVMQVYLENTELGNIKSNTLSKWFFEQYLTSAVTPSFTNSIANALANILNQSLAGFGFCGVFRLPLFHRDANCANRRTRMATVDVSLRFLPSLLNLPMFSQNSHLLIKSTNFPFGRCCDHELNPVSVSSTKEGCFFGRFDNCIKSPISLVSSL